MLDPGCARLSKSCCLY